MRRWQQRGRLGVVAAASFVLLVLVLPQVATGIGLGSLAARITGSGSCGSGSGSSGSGGSGSGSSVCGPPTLTAIPSTKLGDGQLIEVSGTGFTPDSEINVTECLAGATGQAGCDLSTVSYTSSDGSGSFKELYSVSRIISTTAPSGAPVTSDCAVSSCMLGAGDASNLAVAAVTALTFNPRIPPLFRDTVSSTDKVNASTGVAEVAGTFICRQPLFVQTFVYLDQHHGRFNFENQTYDSFLCKGHMKWTVPVTPGVGLFGAGPATLDVEFSTLVGTGFRTISSSGKITLVDAKTK